MCEGVCAGKGIKRKLITPFGIRTRAPPQLLRERARIVFHFRFSFRQAVHRTGRANPSLCYDQDADDDGDVPTGSNENETLNPVAAEQPLPLPILLPEGECVCV